MHIITVTHTHLYKYKKNIYIYIYIKHIPNIYQKYTKNIPKRYPRYTKIFKIKTKYQAGLRGPGLGPGRAGLGRRPLGILYLSYILDIFGYIFGIFLVYFWYIFRYIFGVHVWLSTFTWLRISWPPNPSKEAVYVILPSETVIFWRPIYLFLL